MDKNNSHIKKMIAPIIIAVMLIVYFIAYALLISILPGLPLIIKILFAIVPLFIAGVTVYVVIERIKEIRSGEEDDLSNY